MTIRRAVSDRRDQEILRLKRRLAEAEARGREIRTEERERFATLSSASKRFAASMRSRIDERQRQQRRLDAQYAVSRVLEESRDLLDAAPGIFRALESRLGWDAGVLWTVETGELVCRGSWRSDGAGDGDFGEACRGQRLPRGAGLPGRVWQREEACWVGDVLEDAGYVLGEEAATGGLRCALAFPIQDGGRLVGVFELLKREPSLVDEDTLRVVYLLGHQMGQFVERRRAEAERDRALFQEREARRQVSGVLESINDAFFAVDRDWRLTYLNRRTEEFWGRTREDLLGKRLWEGFPEAVGTEVERSLKRAMEGGETVGFEAASPASESWVSVRAYPSADGLSVYFQDVSERKKAEAALRRNEARWRALIDKGADVITISARDGTVTFASPSIEAICGYKMEEFVGRSPFEIGHIHPDDLDRCGAAFAELADRPGHSVTIQHRYRHGSGGWRWLEGTFTNLFEDPAVGGLVANFRDVTERKRAEEKSRRAAGLDAFRVELNDALRPLTDPAEIQAAAARVLCERLRADGAHHARVDEERGLYRVERDFVRGDAPSMVGDYPMSDFAWLGARFLEDGRLVISDARTAPLVPESERAAVAAIPVAALVSVPLVKDGRFVSAFSVVSLSPREWTAEEVDLVGETAERTRAAVERVRIEQALRESGERLRRVIEIDTVGILFFDPAGRLTDANDAFLEQSGYAREDVERGLVSWQEMTPPEWRERSRQAVEELQKTGRTTPYEKGYIRKDGSRWWGLFAATLLEGGEGVEFAVDITERRRAGEALRESEEWLRLAQQAARSGTWEWDLTSGEILWSPEHRELFGFDPSDEPIDRGEWWGIVHPDDLPSIEEAGRRCLEEGGEWPEMEYRISRPDDGERWINARGRTERDGTGKPVRVLGISTDVTARKEAEAERDRLRAQEWIAAAEAAERERISRELHDRVAHSMGVAHQSLQLYGIFAGKDPARAAEKLELAKEMAKTSLESTRNLSAELRELEAEEGLEQEIRHLLDVSVPPGVAAEISVEGDESPVPGHVRGQLFLVLREAVRNAVAHSECACVRVNLSFDPEEARGLVEDDGRGFDTSNGTAGVGLRSMRERAALLGGALELSGGPRRGTRVEVTIPLKGGR